MKLFLAMLIGLFFASPVLAYHNGGLEERQEQVLERRQEQLERRENRETRVVDLEQRIADHLARHASRSGRGR